MSKCESYTVNGTTHPGVVIRWENTEKSILTAKIEEGGKTLPHTHSGIETFHVKTGQGVITIGGISRPVYMGDTITIPPNTVHSLTAKYGALIVEAVFNPPFSEQKTIITNGQ